MWSISNNSNSKMKSCSTCGLYPCFSGIDKLKSDFGAYGCRLWRLSKSGTIGKINNTCKTEGHKKRT